MTRILVVWEDDRFETLNLFVKRRLNARKPPSQVVFPRVMFHTSRGNGRFKPYVRDTWTQVRGKGLPGDPGPIDHLLCVVDGDKLHGLLPSVGNPSTQSAAVWHPGANAAWQAYLHQQVDPSVPAGTVHGHVLRWCKESLALAGHDQPPAARHLGLDPDKKALQEYLAACSPDPRQVPDKDFSDHYWKPVTCLDGARKALQIGGSIKNAIEIDDTLRELVEQHLPLVCSRVADIDQIVDLLWSLSTPGGAPAPAAPLPAASPPGASRKGKAPTPKPPGKAASRRK